MKLLFAERIMSRKVIKGIEIYYECHGNEEGKPILFLNGLTQSVESWYGYLDAFRNKYYIVLLDLIGQPKSQKNEKLLTFEEHAQLCVNLMESLSIKSFNLVGISYGGLVAQRLAYHFPDQVERLVIMAACSIKTPHFKLIEQSWWKALKLNSYEDFAAIILPWAVGTKIVEHPSFNLEKMQEYRKLNPISIQSLNNLMGATKKWEDYSREVAQIKCDTLLMGGQNDYIFPVSSMEELHSNMTHSILHIIKDVGHTLNIEAVDITASYMLKFFDN